MPFELRLALAEVLLQLPGVNCSKGQPPPLDARSAGALAIALIALGACTSSSASYLSHEELLDAQSCQQCHPKQYQDWSSSMHAYASEDPIFLAMNQRGQREAGIGDFCVKCHAPMAVREGATTDGLNLDTVPQSLKGITCYFCHSVDGVADTHNNPLQLANDGLLRGPYADPFANPAHPSAYSLLHDRDQLGSASLCGSCHDIVNDHGTQIERTYAEWQETVFAQPTIGTTCGQCHMDQSTDQEPAATSYGAPLRRTHSHLFPAIDLPIDHEPDQATRDAVQAFLDTSLQSALCVRGAGTANLQLVLDNVAAGHHFPSGAAQDRRVWAEVTAYSGDAASGGTALYQSGQVAAGTPVTSLTDPDLWLLRDCLFDAQSSPVHMFWAAADYETNLLPGQLTFDSSDPRYYQTHVYQTYPRDGSQLQTYPARVTAQMHLEPIGLDVIDDLVQSGDLVDTDRYTVAELRQRLASRSIGAEIEWTPDTATQRFIDNALPVSCVSTTNLNASADKVPAVNHSRCTP